MYNKLMKKSTYRSWLILGLFLIIGPALLTEFADVSYGAEGVLGALVAAGVIFFLIGVVKGIIDLIKKR